MLRALINVFRIHDLRRKVLITLLLLAACRIGAHIPTPGDEGGLRRLGVNVTSEPNFASKDLSVT